MGGTREQAHQASVAGQGGKTQGSGAGVIRGRGLLWTFCLAFAVAATLWVATKRLFIAPSADRLPARADAVIILSGDAGDRLQRATELMKQGRAPVLVIVNGRQEAPTACADRRAHIVLCPTPASVSTRGDAKIVGTLAEKNAWTRIIVVTSEYHVTRARVLLKRCTAAEIHMAASKREMGRRLLVSRVIHEWLGLLRALLPPQKCQ